MAFNLDDLNYDKDSLERKPWEHYMELFAKADPKEISMRTGFPYEEEKQVFSVKFMGRDYQIHYPDFQVFHQQNPGVFYPLEEIFKAKVLTVRYMLEASPVKPTGKMLTYRETPWGDVYLRQFNGRCIMRLAYSYGNRLEKFREIMEKLGASPVKFGDCAYQVELLPDLYVQMILWEGDEEFPPSSQILFSDNFPVCFQAEDMAVTGDVIIGTLKAMEKY